MYFNKYNYPFINYYNCRYRNATNMYVRKAVAHITVGPLAPDIKGKVTFTQVRGGTEVSVKINGLPSYRPAANGNPQVGPDDYKTQPSGASGKKLTCGVITAVYN